MTSTPIADLIPHADEMILLDSIQYTEGERIVCAKTVQADGLFVDANGHLPAWVGVELMAQSIAAWAGCHAREADEPVRLGFLLGTRQYTCNVDAFPLGTRLVVEAERTFHDEHGMAVFTCRIDAAGIHAEARLNVYRPRSADAILKQIAGDTPHV